MFQGSKKQEKKPKRKYVRKKGGVGVGDGKTKLPIQFDSLLINYNTPPSSYYETLKTIPEIYQKYLVAYNNKINNINTKFKEEFKKQEKDDDDYIKDIRNKYNDSLKHPFVKNPINDDIDVANKNINLLIRDRFIKTLDSYTYYLFLFELLKTYINNIDELDIYFKEFIINYLDDSILKLKNYFKIISYINLDDINKDIESRYFHLKFVKILGTIFYSILIYIFKLFLKEKSKDKVINILKDIIINNNFQNYGFISDGNTDNILNITLIINKYINPNYNFKINKHNFDNLKKTQLNSDIFNKILYIFSAAELYTFYNINLLKIKLRLDITDKQITAMRGDFHNKIGLYHLYTYVKIYKLYDIFNNNLYNLYKKTEQENGKIFRPYSIINDNLSNDIFHILSTSTPNTEKNIEEIIKEHIPTNETQQQEEHGILVRTILETMKNYGTVELSTYQKDVKKDILDFINKLATNLQQYIKKLNQFNNKYIKYNDNNNVINLIDLIIDDNVSNIDELANTLLVQINDLKDFKDFKDFKDLNKKILDEYEKDKKIIYETRSKIAFFLLLINKYNPFEFNKKKQIVELLNKYIKYYLLELFKENNIEKFFEKYFDINTDGENYMNNYSTSIEYDKIHESLKKFIYSNIYDVKYVNVLQVQQKKQNKHESYYEIKFKKHYKDIIDNESYKKSILTYHNFNQSQIGNFNDIFNELISDEFKSKIIIKKIETIKKLVQDIYLKLIIESDYIDEITDEYSVKNKILLEHNAAKIIIFNYFNGVYQILTNIFNQKYGMTIDAINNNFDLKEKSINENEFNKNINYIASYISKILETHEKVVNNYEKYFFGGYKNADEKYDISVLVKFLNEAEKNQIYNSIKESIDAKIIDADKNYDEIYDRLYNRLIINAKSKINPISADFNIKNTVVSNFNSIDDMTVILYYIIFIIYTILYYTYGNTPDFHKRVENIFIINDNKLKNSLKYVIMTYYKLSIIYYYYDKTIRNKLIKILMNEDITDEEIKKFQDFIDDNTNFKKNKTEINDILNTNDLIKNLQTLSQEQEQ